MSLAIFDLDNTLIGGDSDVLWGDFLGERGIVDKHRHEDKHQRFYQEYVNGTLDIYEFLRFQLEVLGRFGMEQLKALRADYIDQKIRPLLLPKAMDLLQDHRMRGHPLLIITATNRFVTEPIAALLGVNDLIATEPEIRDGRYTGDVDGMPAFAEGKVSRLKEWLAANEWEPTELWFYSDSHNDIPLLEYVNHPVAVDPDEKLANAAGQRNWPILSLR